LFFNLAGLDAGKIKQGGTIRGQESTRRIGDYKVKYGYTDIELLRSEKFNFVVSIPSLCDPSFSLTVTPLVVKSTVSFQRC